MPRLTLSGWLALAVSLLAARSFAAEPNAEARRLYAEGKAEYAQGHYAEAVVLFERSYALFQAPALLFNMAQAQRLAGPTHCADALALYKSYLSAQPDAENKREVEERIQELAECPAAQPPSAAAAVTPAPAASAELDPVSVVRPAPAPLPPAPAPAAAAPAASASPVAPIVVAAAGAALLVAGGVLYARAWDKHREAEKVCPCYPGTYDNWEVLTNVSYALLGVGGVALGGGVTWWAVAQPSHKAQGSRASFGFSARF